MPNLPTGYWSDTTGYCTKIHKDTLPHKMVVSEEMVNILNN